MAKKKVGVVCGGFSSEFDISIQSGDTVYKELNRNVWEVYLITIKKNSWIAQDDQGLTYRVSSGDFSLHGGDQIIVLDVIFNGVITAQTISTPQGIEISV